MSRIPGSPDQNVTIGSGLQLDAYGRLRDSTPNMLLSSILDGDKRSDIWDEHITIPYDGGIGGVPVIKELATGAGGATGRIVSFTGDATAGVLVLADVLGVFVEDEQLTTGGTFDAAVDAPGGVVNGVHNADASTYAMTVGTAAGDCHIRQSRVHWPYRAGQSQQIMETFTMNPAKTGLRQRIGYFNEQNGIFIELNDEELRLVIRSNATGSVVDTVVSQADWSTETLVGTRSNDNPSGQRVDLSLVQILTMDLQWLGAGSVRYAVDLEGESILMHEAINSNVSTTVYMGTAALPVRYEIENTGITASPSTMGQISSAVVREGGGGEPGFLYGADNNTAGLAATTTLQTMIGIRASAAHIRTALRVLDAEVLNDGNTSLHWALVVDPVYTGDAVWAAVHPNSAAEFSISNLEVTDQGRLVRGGYAPGSAGGRGAPGGVTLAEGLIAGAAIDETPQEVWLVASMISSTATARGSMHWREVR